jgi:tRNA 2-selenouridine synthase
MSSVMASIAAMVHPHQIEVQDFDVYDLIIDARSEAEFEQDHIPGALSLPVSVGSGVRATQAAFASEEGHGVQEMVALNYGCAISAAVAADVPATTHVLSFADEQRLRRLVSGLQPGAFVLIYCSRGGLHSMAWAAQLRRMGFEVDVLGGGWPNYRNWVTAGLETLAGHLSFRFMQGAPMGGLEELLACLCARGQQVIHLDWIASEASVPGCAWPAERAVHQERLDTVLLDALRRIDAQRPVWLGRCWPLPEGLVLPAALERAMERGPWVRLRTPVEERARGWRRWLDDGERRGVSVQDSTSELARHVMGMPVQVEVAKLVSADLAQTAERLATLLGHAVAAVPLTAHVQLVELPGFDEPTLDLAASQCISAAQDDAHAR